MYQDFYYCGEVIADASLEPVACALAEFPCPFHVRRSGYDGTSYLRTPGSEEFDFEMSNAQSRQFLFSGFVEGTLARAMELLGSFSQCLTKGGFAHRIELYNVVDDISGEQLLGYFHHRWPKGQSNPT